MSSNVFPHQDVKACRWDRCTCVGPRILGLCTVRRYVVHFALRPLSREEKPAALIEYEAGWATDPEGGTEKSLATAGNRIADRENSSLFTTPTTLPPQFIKPLKTSHVRLEKLSTLFSLYREPFLILTSLLTNYLY